MPRNGARRMGKIAWPTTGQPLRIGWPIIVCPVSGVAGSGGAAATLANCGQPWILSQAVSRARPVWAVASPKRSGAPQ